MDVLSLTLFFAIFIFALGVGITIFWLWMLIDALKRKFKTSTDKLIWITVIISANVFGAIIYYFLVKRKER